MLAESPEERLSVEAVLVSVFKVVRQSPFKTTRMPEVNESLGTLLHDFAVGNYESLHGLNKWILLTR